jgi:hypothetical protein
LKNWRPIDERHQADRCLAQPRGEAREPIEGLLGGRIEQGRAPELRQAVEIVDDLEQLGHRGVLLP